MSDTLYRRTAAGIEPIYPRTLAANVLTADGETVEEALGGVAGHPTHTAHPLGLYKVANDNKGHVAQAEAVEKDDLTALGVADAAEMQPALNVARANIGDPTVFEAGLIDEQLTNKLRFYPPSLIAWEQSDDGETWSELVVDESTNKKLVMGRATNADVLLLPKGKLYRFTITRRSYSLALNVLYLYCSTRGASWKVKIEAYNETSGLWTVTTPETNAFSAWPKHVTVRHATISLYPPSTSTTSAQKVRVTIRVSSGSISSYPNAMLNSIQWWGGYPADTRSLYSWDENKAATFPAKVTAPTFAGALTGNAATATKLNTDAGSANQPVYFSGGKPVATTHTLGASVPADAVFTDTTYEVATEEAAGLMSAGDKAKLDGISLTGGAAVTSALLWSGSWSTGAISIPYASDYAMFVVEVQSVSDAYLTRCNIVTGNAFVEGSGSGYSSSGSGVNFAYFKATVSGDQWTYVRACFSANPTTKRAVTRIWGMG